jgi:hypothetical protein
MLLSEAAVMVIPAAMLGIAIAAAIMPHLPEEVRKLSGVTISAHTIVTAIVLAAGLSVAISIVPGLRTWRMPIAAGLARE